MVLKNGAPLNDLEQWRRQAGPKSPDQWVEGRSAWETGRFWLAAGSTLPEEISDSLLRHARFGRVISWRAEPEVRLRFDNRRGEPRKTDILVEAADEFGKFIIAVEAKADEPFDRYVSDTLAAAIERRLCNERSRGVERIHDLAAALLGPRRKGEPAVGRLRYQLLTGVAGALAEGIRTGVDRVVFLVQVFRNHRTNEEKQRNNGADLDRFLQRLTHLEITSLSEKTLLGPFVVPGMPLFDAPPELFVLKFVTDVRPKE